MVLNLILLSIVWNPFSFELASQGIIPGWNDGISRMRVGSTYIFFVPSDLGYGVKGSIDGSIPPHLNHFSSPIAMAIDSKK